MEENKDRYLEAARMIMECKPSKLPYVLAMLKQGGFDIEDSEIIRLKQATNKRKSKSEYDRKLQNRCVWRATDDPLIVYLRKAYEHGQNMRDFAATIHLSRASLYKIMAGDQNAKPSTRRDIESGLRLYGWIDDTTVL